MDKVRIYWEKLPEEFNVMGIFPPHWVAYASYKGSPVRLFHSYNHDEFFLRYNAIVVEKMPGDAVESEG